nr:MAG TPA_asm: putative internal virion protein B [Bacteriophage sp.]
MGTANTQLLGAMNAGGLATTGSLGGNTSIGMGMQLLSAYNNYRAQRRQAEAQADQIIAQAKGAIKTMNYSLGNFENERRNAFEASVAQLGAIRMQARGLEESVQASTGEYQSGKTAKLLVRSTKADGLRTTNQVKDNYIRKSDEIDQNKERVFLSTREYLSHLETPRIPTLIGGILSQAGALMSAYNDYKNMNANRISKIGDGSGVGSTSGTHVESLVRRWEPDYTFRSASQNPWRTSANDGFSLADTRRGVLGYTVNDPKAINYGNPNIRYDTNSASYQYSTNGFATALSVNMDYPKLLSTSFRSPIRFGNPRIGYDQNSNQYTFNGGML